MGCSVVDERPSRQSISAGLVRSTAVVTLSGWLICAPLSLLVQWPCLAQSDPISTRTVTIDLAGVDVHTVALLLERKTPHLNLVIEDGDRPYKLVYLHVDDAPVETVLRDVALSAGASLTLSPDGSYFLHPETRSDDAARAGDPADAAAGDTTGVDWRKLPLLHAVPSEVLAIMGWQQGQSSGQYDPLSKVRLSPPSSEGGMGGGGVSMAASPTIQINNGGAGGAGQAQVPNAGVAGSQSPGQTAAASAGGNLPIGVRRIIPLQDDNSLLILSTQDGYDRVQKIAALLDIKPRQVQIKVEFVTASVNDVDAFGINFSYVPFISTNQGSSVSTSPETTLFAAQGRAAVQLYDSLVHGRGKVVQAPIVTTTNNVPAQIDIAQQIPYTSTSTLLNGNGTGATNTNTQFLTTHTGLAVSPRINSDDTVTLSLAPQITDISGAALDNGAPPTVTETLTTLRTVMSGETMVIGGLVRKTETHSRSEVPLLSKLPLIGSLFRTRDTTIDDSELLIFVTPTIIGDKSDQSPASREGKSEMDR